MAESRINGLQNIRTNCLKFLSFTSEKGNLD